MNFTVSQPNAWLTFKFISPHSTRIRKYYKDFLSHLSCVLHLCFDTFSCKQAWGPPVPLPAANGLWLPENSSHGSSPAPSADGPAAAVLRKESPQALLSVLCLSSLLSSANTRGHQLSHFSLDRDGLLREGNERMPHTSSCSSRFTFSICLVR